VQSLDEVLIAGLLGLSMDGPAAYLQGVMQLDHYPTLENSRI